MSGSGGPGRPSKVARVIETYDLADLGAELERRWTAPPDRRDSLRDLADVVNRRVLEAALRVAGRRPLAGDADAIYRRLVAEDDRPATRTRTRRRLERAGVDVEAVESDFVSHAAVRTYLTEHRGVTHDADVAAGGPGEAIARLRGRLEVVTADRLAAAQRRDAITLGDHDVTVSVRVACRDCGQQADATALLEAGGCGCDAE